MQTLFFHRFFDRFRAFPGRVDMQSVHAGVCETQFSTFPSEPQKVVEMTSKSIHFGSHLAAGWSPWAPKFGKSALQAAPKNKGEKSDPDGVRPESPVGGASGGGLVICPCVFGHLPPKVMISCGSCAVFRNPGFPVPVRERFPPEIYLSRRELRQIL